MIFPYLVLAKERVKIKTTHVLLSGKFTCHSIEDFKRIYNMALSGNLEGAEHSIRYRNCRIIKAWTIGHINKTSDNESLVRFTYFVPYTDDSVETGWVHISFINTIDEYKKRFL